MAKTFVVEVTIPELPEGQKKWNVGDTFSIEVEVPVAEKKPRGQLAGIALVDMTDDQLKREIINANSVLYKAKQRGASEETIAANQARVDAAQAEKAKRQGTKAPEATEAVADVIEGNSEVYTDAETASEM
jgi:hypothetical protein